MNAWHGIGLGLLGAALVAAVALAKYRWPVRGVITSPFGPRVRPNGDHQFHNGVDIAAPAGTPILSPGRAEVLRTWFDARGGNSMRLMLSNGDVIGLAHLREFLVEPGEMVTRGQAVGLVGATGDATGPHLHLTLTRGGELVDPEKYFA